jgi:peptidoglycan DL-endopeptidase CwlO
MSRLALPPLPRPSLQRRSTGVIIAALLLASISTAATAVTAELHEHTHNTFGTGAPPTRPLPSAPTVHAAAGVSHSAKPKHLINATLLVSRRTPLSRHEIRAVRHVRGVHQTQMVRAGHAKIDGHRAFVVGVDPANFRPWTPKPTAASNPLWASISQGNLAVSFDMGHNAKLPLGKTVPVAGPRGVTPVRIGAFASVGMAGVDAVVAQSQADRVGLQRRTGVVISAPKTDPLALQRRVKQIFGKHAQTELLQEVVVTRDAGEFLTRAQIGGFLKAAASRAGAPYVWGAEGPNSFDCSGLVQWSFAQIGIRMPRVAQEQFFTGPHIPYKDARPGDLLFWHYDDPIDPSFIDHVAIYLGNGMMLEAPHTGDVVKEIAVPLAHMAGVVRVDPAIASQVAG